MTRRYAKGEARREEVLGAALSAYAASDRQGPRLRDIANVTGLTEAGVLHYFESKDHLFVALLESRDHLAAEQHDLTTEAGLWAYLAATLTTPGLVKLFVDMSAAASDPQHPAHAFFDRHDQSLQALLRTALGVDDPQTLRLFIAAAEGLQLRWLRHPETDLVADLRTLVQVFRTNKEVK